MSDISAKSLSALRRTLTLSSSNSRVRGNASAVVAGPIRTSRLVPSSIVPGPTLLISFPSTSWQNQVPHSRFLNRQNKTSLFISNLDLHCLGFYSRPGSCAFIRSNYLAVLLVQTKIQEQAQEK